MKVDQKKRTPFGHFGLLARRGCTCSSLGFRSPVSLNFYVFHEKKSLVSSCKTETMNTKKSEPSTNTSGPWFHRVASGPDVLSPVMIGVQPLRIRSNTGFPHRTGVFSGPNPPNAESDACKLSLSWSIIAKAQWMMMVQLHVFPSLKRRDVVKRWLFRYTGTDIK